jgi:hypothetical protein
MKASLHSVGAKRIVTKEPEAGAVGAYDTGHSETESRMCSSSGRSAMPPIQAAPMKKPKFP